MVRNVDTKERFEKLFMNSMAFIMKGSSRKGFDHNDVVEFLPRLILTHIVDLMKQQRHISIIAIRRLFNFVRILLFLMSKDPKIEQKMNEKLEAFISDPARRVKHGKEGTPNLGDMLVFACISSKFRF